MRLGLGSLRDRWARRPPSLPAATSAPEQRAEALLLRHLSPAQRATYLGEGWFEVRGRDGSLWTIDRRGGSRNVRCINARGTRTYCTDLPNVPRADTLLVQKLCIEATGGRGLPYWAGIVLIDEHLFHGGRAATGPANPSVPDPVALSMAAVDERKLGRLAHAEDLLRQAIAIEDRQVAARSPRRAHRRNNLALVLTCAGKLEEARRVTAEAWRLRAGRHDMTSARILVVRVALRFLEGGRDVAGYLGQLKTLLGRETLECLGDIAPTWEVPDVLAMLRARLPGTDADLLVEISETLNDRGRLPSLRAFAAWRAAAAVPLETAWPED